MLQKKPRPCQTTSNSAAAYLPVLPTLIKLRLPVSTVTLHRPFINMGKEQKQTYFLHDKLVSINYKQIPVIVGTFN